MLKFSEIKESDLEILDEWYKDEEVIKRLGGTLPLQRWFGYVQENQNYFAWIIYDDNLQIGQSCIEIYPDQTASVSILTNPKHRKQGYGQKMLEKLLEQTELSTVQLIRVGIEPDNLASLRVFKKVGFTEGERDEDGFIVLTYLMSSAT